MIEFSLILPVHNESTIIKTVVDEIVAALNKMKISYEIILVENGSTDKSLDVIKELSLKNKGVKTLIAEKGFGSAAIAGLSKAKGKYACYMSSDGQVDLNLISKLWKEIQSDKYDLVKIRRIRRESLVRDLTTWALSISISILFNTKFLDVNGSPRIFLRKHLKKLDLQSKDSFIDAEFLIKISKLNWKIKEIPMKNIERYGGKSTRSINTYLEFIKNIYLYKTSNIITKWKENVAKY